MNEESINKGKRTIAFIHNFTKIFITNPNSYSQFLLTNKIISLKIRISEIWSKSTTATWIQRIQNTNLQNITYLSIKTHFNRNLLLYPREPAIIALFESMTLNLSNIQILKLDDISRHYFIPLFPLIPKLTQIICNNFTLGLKPEFSYKMLTNIKEAANLSAFAIKTKELTDLQYPYIILALEFCRKLTILKLHISDFTNAMSTQIAHLLECGILLRILSLKGKFGNKSFNILSKGLKSGSKLDKLEIIVVNGGNNVFQADPLFDSLKYIQLTEIILTKFQFQTTPQASVLLASDSIKSLSINKLRFSKSNYFKFIDGKSNLTSIKSERINNSEFKWIVSNSEKFPELINLNLSYSKLSNLSGGKKGISFLKQLKYINFNGTNLDFEGIEMIILLIRMSPKDKLEYLDISGIYLTETQLLEIMEALVSNNSIKTFKMNEVHMSSYTTYLFRDLLIANTTLNLCQISHLYFISEEFPKIIIEILSVENSLRDISFTVTQQQINILFWKAVHSFISYKIVRRIQLIVMNSLGPCEIVLNLFQGIEYLIRKGTITKLEIHSKYDIQTLILLQGPSLLLELCFPYSLELCELLDKHILVKSFSISVGNKQLFTTSYDTFKKNFLPIKNYKYEICLILDCSHLFKLL